MTLTGTVIAVIQAILVILSAPVVAGIVHKIHARLEGRQGASVLQPWRNLRKLLRKERIRPSTTSWVFQAAPIVVLTSLILVAGIVPMLTTQLGPDPVGDLFTVVLFCSFSAPCSSRSEGSTPQPHSAEWVPAAR